MSARAIGAAAILFLSLSIFHAIENLLPRTPSRLVAAPPCRFPVEREGVGVECWEGRGAIAQVRPGDRVDAVGRARGRMAPEAIEAYALPIDLNRADAVELATLPGIGPSLAARIVADRAQKGSFRRVEELGRVVGIGERTLARLRSRLVVEPEGVTERSR